MDNKTILKIEQLTDEIHQLVEESTNEGFRHLKRLVDEYDKAINRFDKHGEALFVAYAGTQIAGVCGLNQDPYSIDRLGRVRRLYVSKNYRRQGIAKSLMDKVIEEAKMHYEMIVLKTYNPAADRFYLSLGFSTESMNEKVSHYLIFR